METSATTTAHEKLLYKQVKKVHLSELIKNKLPKGKTHAIIEPVSGDILSFCSEDYTLRKNSSLYKPFEKLLKEKKISFFKTVRVIDGNKFYVDYVIRKRLKSILVNDIFPKLSIWNSYDGTVKTQIKFGYHKLLHGNGLSRPMGCQIHLSSKHSTDEQEFSLNTIPHFLDLFNIFLSETKNDMKVFENLHKKKSSVKELEEISAKLKFSKETRDVAVFKLTEESKGNFTYVNEHGKLVNHKGGPVTLFTTYNALNYAIYHTNPKELPEFKLKKDGLLIEAICNICKLKKVKRMPA